VPDHVVLPSGNAGDRTLHGVHYSSRLPPSRERDELCT
jgi:hypothetical protein